MFLKVLGNYFADKITDPRVTCAVTILGSVAHLASYVEKTGSVLLQLLPTQVSQSGTLEK